MLVRCLYASRSTGAITDETVHAIIDKSRRNNPVTGITGLLCADDQNYVQVLEGGREQVSALFKRIMSDNRHSDVTLLSFEEIDTRHYGSWTMARLDVSTTNPAMVLKYSESDRFDPFTSPASSTMRLLADMVDSGVIVGRDAR